MAGRLDLFLTRDERNLRGADSGCDLIVDLPGQEAQRQAYDTAVMRQQARDRQMGLTRVGGTQYGGYRTRGLGRGVGCEAVWTAHRASFRRMILKVIRLNSSSLVGRGQAFDLCLERVKNECRPNR